MTIKSEEAPKMTKVKEKKCDFGRYIDPSRIPLPGECFTTNEKDIGW